MFDPKKVNRTRRSFELGADRRPVATHSCDTLGSAYGTFLTPTKPDSSSSGSRSSRRSSFEFTLNAYYDCDEPELECLPEVQAVQDQIAEITIEPTHYPFRLYISGLKAANDLSILKEHNIRAVLSIGTTNIPGHFNFIQAYFTVPLPNASHNISADLHQALSFLDYELNRHNVLVHDFFGVNRSIVVVAALLMRTLRISHLKALKLVKEARQVTEVSDWLMRSLEAFELEARNQHVPS